MEGEGEKKGEQEVRGVDAENFLACDGGWIHGWDENF